MAAEAGPASDAANQLGHIEKRQMIVNLKGDHIGVGEKVAEAANILTEAELSASGHDAHSTERGIAHIDVRQAADRKARRRLEIDIAQLEG